MQASTLELLMRRRGLEPELKIGVRKEDGRLAAHAWVEYEGQEYLEGSLDGHFASLPAGRW